MGDPRIEAKLAAYKGIRSFGHDGLADELSALKPRARPQAPREEAHEAPAPASEEDAPDALRDLDADALEQMIGRG